MPIDRWPGTDRIWGEVKRHTREQYKISGIHVLYAVGMCAGGAISIGTDELQSE